VRVNGERPIVARQVAGVVLLQGEEATEAIAGFVEQKCGQQPGCSAVAVVIGMDGHELIVNQGGDEGGGQPGPLRLCCPGHQGSHQGRDVLCLRRKVNE